MRRLTSILIVFLLITASKCAREKGSSVTYESISGLSQYWVAEVQDKANSKVTWSDNKIEIEVSKGATVWFKEQLHGKVVIEYDATVIDNGGAYDRVSDLNCFWMFSDPKQPDGDIKLGSNERNGLFRNYHSLQGYYVGLGGHDNTKTRFRRYNGNMDRPLKPEHDLTDTKYLIVPNKKYHIKLIVDGETVQYWRDDLLVFNEIDATPYKSGWFGFRTLTNHMIIENVKIQSDK